MKYEQINVTQAINRFIKYRNPDLVHHDDLTEALLPCLTMKNLMKVFSILFIHVLLDK